MGRRRASRRMRTASHNPSSSSSFILQVWDDVRSTVTVITTDADGVRLGPVGTTAK